LDAQQQFDIEQEKLRLQKHQMRLTWLTVVIAALSPIVTIWVVLSSIRANSDIATAAQITQLLADTGERICVPDIESDSLLGSTNVEELSELLASLELESFCQAFTNRPPSLAVQMQLIQQLIEHPKQRSVIIDLWRSVYEKEVDGEDWLDSIASNAPVPPD
jgi:hypothetical protein